MKYSRASLMGVCLLLVLLFISTSCTNFRKIYDKEREQDIAINRDYITNRIIDESDIAYLPSPVQRYFQNCGYIGQKYIVNADIIWKESFYRGKPDAKWMKMKTRQYNSVVRPMRIAHMKAYTMGIIPFEGRDKYNDAKGHMFGKIMGIIPVFDAKDSEIAHSALITIFAETLFLPTYALQSYIEWEEVDEFTAIARIDYKGVFAEGTFYFDEGGYMTKFETKSRYFSLPNGEYKKEEFFVEIYSYKDQGEILIPESVSANWIIDGERFEYWKGSIQSINYNVTK